MKRWPTRQELEVLRDMPLRGDFAVPGVGLDGSSGGLSADGRTLVLTERRASIPRPHTAFAVLRADRPTADARASASAVWRAERTAPVRARPDRAARVRCLP